MRAVFQTLFLLTLAWGAAGQTILDLSVDPAVTLPGIPVRLDLDLKNSASSEVEISNVAALLVREESGHTFFASRQASGSGDVAFILQGQGDTITLGPEEKRTLSFWPNLSSPIWFCDARLQQPGVYQVKIILDLDLRELGSHEMPGEEHPRLSDGIHSGWVQLEIATPEGVDGEVWEWKQDNSPSCGWSPEVAMKVWEQWSESRYAPYLMPVEFGAEPSDIVQAARRSISSGPNFMTPYHQLNLATALVGLMDSAVWNENEKEAVEISREVDEILKALELHGDERIRDAAGALRKKWESPSEIRSRLSAAQDHLGVEVFSECVSPNPDGSMTAWFGYNNRTNSVVNIPEGKENNVSPAVADGSLPTHFLAGLHNLAAAFTSRGSEIVWHFRRTPVHASAKKSPPCPCNVVELSRSPMATELDARWDCLD